VEKSKKFLKQFKKLWKKTKKFVQKKKTLYVLFGVSFLLILSTLIILNSNLVPNSDIRETKEDEIGIFSNSNPSFDVLFGKKDNESVQWIRFESETKESNSFDPNYQPKKRNILEKVSSIFQKKEKLGIEMSLSGVKLSETGSETIKEKSDGELKVSDILGTENIQTSTELLEVGRLLGKNDSEQNISKETILNRDVWKGIDLEYQILEGIGVKEEIIVRSLESYMGSCSDSETDCEVPLNEYIFDLQLDKGVELHQSLVSVGVNLKGTYYFTDSDGNYLAHFLPSFAFDTAGVKTTAVDLTIGETDTKGLYKIHVVLDLNWLLSPERVFPIHIDPSIVHDDSGDFDAGSLNRLEDATGPKIQLVEQELSADVHTVGLWHMDEDSGTSVADSSGNSNTGTAMGTTVVTGMFDDARSFNGSSDYIQVGDVLDMGTNDMTISAWIKTNNTSSDSQYIVSKSYYGGMIGRWYLGTNLGKVRCGFAIASGGIPLDSNDIVADGEWHFVTCLFDRDDKLSIYIDGEKDSDVDISGGDGEDLQTSQPLRIGAYTNTNGDPMLYFDGLIDEVCISDIARTTEEIKASAQKRPYGTYISDTIDLTDNVSSIDDLQWTETGVSTGDGETPYSTTGLVGQWDFNETSGTTADNEGSCGASCDGTLTNMTTTGQDDGIGTGWTGINKKWGEGALMFDGSNDYVDYGSDQDLFVGDTDFTWSAWIKPDILKIHSDIFVQESSSPASAGGSVHWEYMANGQMRLAPYGCGEVLSEEGKVEAGKWNYVVVTFDHSTKTTTHYVNAKKVGSGTHTCNWSFTMTHAASGARYLDGTSLKGTLNGTVDSLKVYERILNDSEILSNYNSTNIEFLTRTSADGSTWEEWKPSTGETQIDSMDGPYLYDDSESGLVAYWSMDEKEENSCTGGEDVCDPVNDNDGTAIGTTIIDGVYGKGRV